MKIAGKELRPGREAFIVAEIGVNHCGDMQRGWDLIRSAKRAGADAVKFQWFTAGGLCSLAVPQETRSLLARCQLTLGNLIQLACIAKDMGLGTIVTAFSPNHAAMLRGDAFDAVKVASPDIVYPELLAAAVAGGPTIISTGGATRIEIADALCAVGYPQNIAVLHCVSKYDPPFDPLFGEMQSLGHYLFEYNIPVGFSDHTADVATGARARDYGATIIEAHIGLYGDEPDAKVSLLPDAFTEYVRRIRADDYVPTTGGGSYALNRDGERATMLSARQSVVTVDALQVGEVIVRVDLTAKRPGTGIPIRDMSRVIGRRAARPIKADVPIRWDDLVPESTTPADSSAASAATPPR